LVFVACPCLKSADLRKYSQVQVTAQGGAHDLLPVLIAVLVLVAATCRPSQSEP